MWRPTTPFVCRSFRPEVSLGPRNNLSTIFKASRLWWSRAIQTRASCYCIHSRRRRADWRFTPEVDNFPRRTTPIGKFSRNGSAVRTSSLLAQTYRRRVFARVLSALVLPIRLRSVKKAVTALDRGNQFLEIIASAHRQRVVAFGHFTDR